MCPVLPATPENAPESVERLAMTLHRLDEAHRRYRVHSARVVGLAPMEVSALLAVGDTPGITPTALARDLVITSGSTTAVIDRLEKAGHVVRTKHPDDRRSLHLHLTAAGTDAMTNLREAYRYVLSTTGTDETILSAIPQLHEITEALNAAVNESPDGA
ncbi:MarR family transcriptional regulator [Frigoribacterium sp. CFBP9039]|uniref:MarR family winged helix-turn-helix transcriptional regulator n=1 Tax=Frigoribacterium TaxID=96492 RepID=UPI00177D6600|nr:MULTISPECIES: MarR family transcriptional regulator [Frigoribacterium]MBD8704804.1 MarR family transcriptional regulator [Frigoribacterium sp. CFBP 13712]MCJ0701668.1 MarR family transcriptional regulator [Frigoribacterium faeni]MDY0893118.1 MarR family transcriptional regulator [Frigoribacterium sp. CFBP9030]MDY0946563.1 MarR family transcriptional regulator [Frigoribacterium sp. CFBP9039]